MQGVLGEDRTSRDVAVLLGHLTDEDYLSAVVDRLAEVDKDLLALERELTALPANSTAEHIDDLSLRLAARARDFITASERIEPPDSADPSPQLSVALISEILLGPMNPAQRRVMENVFEALADLE